LLIVEVDAAWYALKGALADDPCPPASSSTVAIARSPALIGRSSASRGLRPEVPLDSDTGVSRRHAQLTVDGSTLSVTDLSSTNGTYVLPAGTSPDESSEALAPGVARQLADGDAIYLGAWTRLVVRRA
jgi:pSer/pThr/pTyr-binding forkhead associated (FHA) protein